ncbi:hypothetical protein LEP1GSC016_1573 [Leptospira borgpetersenii serovar Hardjo-bovis str. Sponselee]|uniref:Uncharacterized protein n=2 Tax=Leptospira borgpetersenii TaxID=174 RepID=M6C2M1_LEPBO|nr:hypothetical protein LEP1GSC016_1573 [Leptospira borgpetersenii serovar Hardjo-bovis str. Sponselee]EMO64107.1 hypothetical protein LEP1GSC133_1036 [Leptospira borgpetersenii serovar Pomona str. 200901868]
MIIHHRRFHKNSPRFKTYWIDPYGILGILKSSSIKVRLKSLRFFVLNRFL